MAVRLESQISDLLRVVLHQSAVSHQPKLWICSSAKPPSKINNQKTQKTKTQTTTLQWFCSLSSDKTQGFVGGLKMSAKHKDRELSQGEEQQNRNSHGSDYLKGRSQ